MFRLFWAAVFMLGGAGQGAADVTVCHGSRDCTVVTGSGASRKLSPEEVDVRGRQNSRDKINDVDCDFASDPPACQTLKNQLLSTFRHR